MSHVKIISSFTLKEVYNSADDKHRSWLTRRLNITGQVRKANVPGNSRLINWFYSGSTTFSVSSLLHFPSLILYDIFYLGKSIQLINMSYIIMKLHKGGWGIPSGRETGKEKEQLKLDSTRIAGFCRSRYLQY